MKTAKTINTGNHTVKIVTTDNRGEWREKSWKWMQRIALDPDLEEKLKTAYRQQPHEST